jgi:predicted neuraminidase
MIAYRRVVVAVGLAVACGMARGELILPKFEQNIETYRVFGQEHPGPYKHPASIAQLDSGDFYIAYYGGANEYSNETAVYGSRYVPESAQEPEQVGRLRVPTHKEPGEWWPPTVIADTPFEGEGNPVVWQAPDGTVWLFYNNRKGDTWCNSRVKAKISKDGAETWSDSFMVTHEEGTMVQGPPIVLKDGDYLLPVYSEKGNDRERTSGDTESFFLRFRPSTNEWAESGRIKSAQGNLQPAVVQLTDNDLFCFLRRGGGYEPTTDGWALRSESHDGGKTWSEGVKTEFPNPNAAVGLIKLQNGDLLFVYNDNMNDRTPLTVAVSQDGGKTWPFRRAIAGGDNDFAYPYAIQAKDGKIHIVFTTNGRTTIMRAVFQEEAITEFKKE